MSYIEFLAHPNAYFVTQLPANTIYRHGGDGEKAVLPSKDFRLFNENTIF